MTAPLGGIEQAADANPVLAWLAVLMAGLGILSVGLAKFVPPLVEAWGGMAEKRRQLRQRGEDARVSDLSQQVDHLTARVWTLEQRAELQQAALMRHAQWDQQVIGNAIAAGVHIDPPPPLWPPATA